MKTFWTSPEKKGKKFEVKKISEGKTIQTEEFNTEYEADRFLRTINIYVDGKLIHSYVA